MDRSSVSRLIKSLEQAGYIRKETSLEDGRSVLLSLTAPGREKTVQALKEKETVFYERISQWDEERLGVFIGMLRDFNGFPR
ncbi:MarR family protein [compost metagenome]